MKKSLKSSLVGIGILMTALVVVHSPEQIKMLRGDDNAAAAIVMLPDTKFVMADAPKKKGSGLTSMEQAIFSLSLTS